MTDITSIRNKAERLKGERDKIRSQITETKQSINILILLRNNLEKARAIIQDVGLKTQQELQFHISDITSLALSVVFQDPYELKVDFVQRRNKTECDLLFTRGGKDIDPLESSGYGAVDVAALALRVASWSMQNPRSRNTIDRKSVV